MADAFQQHIVAQHLKKILAELRTLASRVEALERRQRNLLDPDVPFMESRQVFFPCRVTSLDTVNNRFYGKPQQASNPAVDPFTDATSVGAVWAYVGNGGEMPSIDSDVRVDFVGTHGSSFTPIYGYFAGTQATTTTTTATAATTSTTITVVTATRIESIYFQVKTRLIGVTWAGTESAWTTYHTGTVCTSTGS